MANVDALVQEGMAAIKAGRKEDAKRVLMKAVELDEQSEQGWLWLSACVETPEEQQICLENVLAINPNNEKARKGLAVINQKKGQSAPPPPSTKQDVFGDIGTGSSPFGDLGWDSGDPFASPSSVDWGREESTTAAPQSEAGLPTADELDNWVSGLSVGASPSQPSTPAFGSSSASSPFGDSNSTFDSSFDSGFDAADPFGSTNASNSAGASKSNDPFAFDTPANSDPFSFDMPASASDDNFGFDAVAPSSGGAFDFSSPAPAASNPFGDFSFDDAASPTNSNAPFGSSPFGASSAFDDLDDPFGSSSGTNDDDIFGDAGTAFSFSTPTQSPSKPSPSSAAPFGGNFKDDDPFAELDSADDVFANVPGKKASNPFASKPGAFSTTSVFDDNAPKKTHSGSFAFGADKDGKIKKTTLSPAQQSMFKAIPPDIQAGTSGSKADIKLIATVAGLALLNMISFAMLLLNLMKR